ncbi:MAG: hypothetical protein ACYTFA_00685 [Planctomycetota bacterium]|jgi:hypothetical protein
MNDWLIFLRQSDALISFPLIIGGAALMLFGWRLWKACVALSFGLIGTGAAAAYVGSGDQQWMVALLCGVTLGLVSYWPAKHAVVVLGGIIGGGIAVCVLRDMHVRGLPLQLVTVAAFILSAGLALTNRRLVIIGVTAVLGAILVISGLTVLVMSSPSLYGTLSALAGRNVLVIAFILLVPAVMSWFYQVSEVRRMGAEL